MIRFLILIFPLVLYAETRVEGILTQNEWWSRDKSPYIITNDLTIAEDARLVIEPGVEIIIEKPLRIPENIPQISQNDTFAVKITINGAIRCVGKPDLPIVFKPSKVDKANQYSHWEGIIIDTQRSDETFISFAHFYNASTAITITSGTPLLRNNLFRYNNIGITTTTSSSPRIINSVFADNFLAGIRVNESNPEIYNSIFYSNRNMALWGDQISKISFKYNCLFDNEDQNFANCNPELGILKETNKNGDSTDVFGNIFIDPLFIGSLADKQKREALRKELKESTLKSPSKSDLKKIEDIPALAEGRIFYLSQFSPCVNAGHPSGKFQEPDGSLPDLGIWGGPEFIQF